LLHESWFCIRKFKKVTKKTKIHRSLYLAGKNYEDAGNISRDQKKPEDACSMYEKAAELYQVKNKKIKKRNQENLTKQVKPYPKEQGKEFKLFTKVFYHQNLKVTLSVCSRNP
jgi:hypothetical protein